MNRSFFSLLLYFNLGILLLRLYDVQLHMDCFAPLYLLILVNFSSPNENRLSSSTCIFQSPEAKASLI